MALFERKEGQLASALRTLREAVDVDPHHVDARPSLITTCFMAAARMAADRLRASGADCQ